MPPLWTPQVASLLIRRYQLAPRMGGIAVAAAGVSPTLHADFELDPTGTAIPTAGVAGVGDDPFASGADGATSTFTSDSSVAAAVASGTYAGKITIGATAGITYRQWSFPASSTVHVRIYLYLPQRFTGQTLAPVLVRNAGTLISRLEVNGNGSVSVTNGTTNLGTTTGVIPLSTLVRLEGSWDLTAGTVSVDVYTGHDTTPITNGSLSSSGQTWVASTSDQFRFGSVLTGPTNGDIYTDAWGVSSVARLGPAGTSGTVVPLTDSGSGTDALTVAAVVPLTDDGAGGDTVAVAAKVPLTDTAAATDALSVAVPVALTDTATGSDALTVTVRAPLTDSASGADALTVAARVPVSDSGSGVDTFGIASVPVSLTDSAAGSDSLAVAVATPAIDSGSGSDALAVTARAPLTDSATATDVFTVATAGGDYHPHVAVTAVLDYTPGTAVLAGNGLSTAVLEPSAATAVLLPSEGTATIDTDTGTAVPESSGAVALVNT